MPCKSMPTHRPVTRRSVAPGCRDRRLGHHAQEVSKAPALPGLFRGSAGRRRGPSWIGFLLPNGGLPRAFFFGLALAVGSDGFDVRLAERWVLPLR